MAKISFDRIDNALIIGSMLLLTVIVHEIVSPTALTIDVGQWFIFFCLGWTVLIAKRCVSKLRNRSAQQCEEVQKPESSL
ncbi:MAG TPA: hypothetical protein VGY66_03025 [Gemmataceae bacterium]|jgi:hypothetical protein|nr:hypothetical protein [Gemmataceae bacterium]